MYSSVHNQIRAQRQQEGIFNEKPIGAPRKQRNIPISLSHNNLNCQMISAEVEMCETTLFAFEHEEPIESERKGDIDVPWIFHTKRS